MNIFWYISSNINLYQYIPILINLYQSMSIYIIYMNLNELYKSISIPIYADLWIFNHIYEYTSVCTYIYLQLCISMPRTRSWKIPMYMIKPLLSLVLLPHGRLSYFHPYLINYFLPLNISRVDGIWVTESAVVSVSIRYFSVSICNTLFSFLVDIFTLSYGDTSSLFTSYVALYAGFVS